MVEYCYLLHTGLNFRKWSCQGQRCTQLGDHQVGNWDVNCQHSSYVQVSAWVKVTYR